MTFFMTYFWLIYPQDYRSINQIFNTTKFEEKTIKFFIQTYKDGIYICKHQNENFGHMPYPFFKDSDTNFIKNSKEWFEEQGFMYQGILESRKSKLKKINLIKDEIY